MSWLIKKFRSFLYKIFGKREVYYINGSETLPPPLDTDVEERLIDDIDKEYAKSALIEHNLRLVVYIAKRFEKLQLLLQVHRIDECLVAVTKIDTAPDWCLFDHFCRPLTVGQMNLLERTVFLERGL